MSSSRVDNALAINKLRKEQEAAKLGVSKAELEADQAAFTAFYDPTSGRYYYIDDEVLV